MIKRKIMQMSNSSFIVTLPKDWADFNGLVKGEEIELESKGNDILIKGRVDKDAEFNINVSLMSQDLIWRHLVCAYRKGVSNLVVNYGSKENQQHIMKFIPDLMGWAIVKQDSQIVTIKDIAPIDNSDFYEMFKKVFMLVIDTSDQLLIAISKQDKVALSNIPYCDYNINKFTNLCLRILNLKGNLPNTNSLYKITSTLEEIADEYRKLAVFYPPSNISSDLLSAFKEVNDLLRVYFKVFYDYNSKNLNEFYTKADGILKDFKEIKRKNNTETRAFVTLFTILHLIKSMFEETLVIKI